MRYTVRVREKDPKVVKVLTRGLLAYNVQQVGPENRKDSTLSILDGSGKLVAGLFAYTHVGWLWLGILWVHDSVRRRGLGKRLVRLAEKEAIRRGCRRAHLNTFSFQAPGFYQRLGYKKFGELPDYPKGHRRCFFWKKLRP